MLVGLIQPVSAQVTIEIVNDSGLPDSNVFVKVPCYYVADHTDTTMTPASLFVDLSNPNCRTRPRPRFQAWRRKAPPRPIKSYHPSRATRIPFIRSRSITSIPAAIYFTYDQPFSFTNKVTPSPPPDSTGNAWRYDYAEFTINDQNAQYNALDVTYVDKFGIPLQMEWLRGTNLVAGSYVYASTRTLAELFAAVGLGQAVFALNATNLTAGRQYTGPASYANFARILAPQSVAACLPRFPRIQTSPIIWTHWRAVRMRSG